MFVFDEVKIITQMKGLGWMVNQEASEAHGGILADEVIFTFESADAFQCI